MDTSFILSVNALFTLMSSVPNQTDAGRQFKDSVLPDAEMCGLEELEKFVVHNEDGHIELVPVIRMIIDALACADSANRTDEGWIVCSPWITLRCEEYQYKAEHYKITPLKDEKA